MDFNRNLRIVRTSGPSYPFPYKSNVLWVHHDENNNPIVEIWDHGKWVPVTGVGSDSGDIIIDTEMSDSSSNAIANKTVKKYVDGIASNTDASILSLNEGKVDKEQGKGLSSNDFTDAEKAKLAGLKNYDDTQVRELIAGKADLQHQHTVADITDFPELYYDATAFLTSEAYPSDKYEELLEAVKAKKTVYATIDEEGYTSYIFFMSSANSDGSSSRVLLTTIFADGGYLYTNTFVLQQSGITPLRENISGKVDKEPGKGLSTNDLTDERARKVDKLKIDGRANEYLNGAGLEGLPRLDARMCVRSSRSGVWLGNALSERQGSDNNPARLDGVRPCGRGACGAIHPLGGKVQKGKVMDGFNAHILSDDASTGSVVVGTGISAALLLFFQQSFEGMLPYLVIAAY